MREETETNTYQRWWRHNRRQPYQTCVFYIIILICVGWYLYLTFVWQLFLEPTCFTFWLKCGCQTLNVLVSPSHMVNHNRQSRSVQFWASGVSQVSRSSSEWKRRVQICCLRYTAFVLCCRRGGMPPPSDAKPWFCVAKRGHAPHLQWHNHRFA